MYCVYKHTCPNGKVYIGITSKKTYQRWHGGHGYKTNKYFTRAIEKYKWKNIKHEILYEKLTKEEAEQKEIQLINQYKSNNRNYGYNISSGGNCHGIGHHVSYEARKKIGNATQQRWLNKNKYEKEKEIQRLKDLCIDRKVWNKGKKMSQEAKKNMSIAQKNKYKNGYINPMKGKCLSEQTKKHLSEVHKGRKNTEEAKKKMKEHNKNAKKVIILETKEIYNSGRQLAEKFGVNRSCINGVCNKRRKSCKGYHLMWYDEYIKEE